MLCSKGDDTQGSCQAMFLGHFPIENGQQIYI